MAQAFPAARKAAAIPHWLGVLLLLFAVVPLGGCVTQLAPDYDAELFEGLVAANQKSMVLFAKVEDGSAKADYPQLSDEYAESIAALESLRLRADARPVPPLTKQVMRLKFLSAICDPQGDPQQCLNATEKALGTAVSTVRMLRGRHRDQGLTAQDVQLLRGQYDTAIDQALTVETALKR